MSKDTVNKRAGDLFPLTLPRSRFQLYKNKDVFSCCISLLPCCL